jgi:hypothetical protein
MFNQRLSKWHRQIGWIAAVALFIWGGSAVTHPAMVWFGPQAQHNFPPTMSVPGEALQNLAPLLVKVSKSNELKVIKLVPGESGPLLQLSRDQDSSRRYFDVENQQLLPNHDQSQAEWLASYYTGRKRDEIRRVDFQTDFNHEYPAVNRLLPVYRVAFGAEEAMVAFIHTETGALASLLNPFKNRLQWIFQNLHTFKWLDGLENIRLLLAGTLLVTLAVMAIIGLLLLFAYKPRVIKDGKRRYHRRLAYLAWLPLLAWSASGFYHLLQSSLVERQFGLRLGLPYESLRSEPLNNDSLQTLAGRVVNNLSLIRADDQNLYWRVSVARDQSEQAVSRQDRFAGNAAEQSAIYLPLVAGDSAEPLRDEAVARAMALRFTGASGEQVLATRLVTRFGSEYDFRNKRLPVWAVELNDADKTIVFVDTATGILVDSTRSIDRLEGLSFSILHKWNHLHGVLGPKVRDLLMVCTIFLLLIVTLFGVRMLVNKRRSLPSKRLS